MRKDVYMEELLSEVLKEFRNRYRHMDEVCRQTKELADGLSRNDRVTAQMQLDMRGKELEAVSESVRHIQVYLNSMQNEEGERLADLLKGEVKADGFSYDGLWKELREVAEKTKAVWKRAVEIDSVTSRRLAGDDSYYK